MSSPYSRVFWFSLYGKQVLSCPPNPEFSGSLRDKAPVLSVYYLFQAKALTFVRKKCFNYIKIRYVIQYQTNFNLLNLCEILPFHCPPDPVI